MFHLYLFHDKLNAPATRVYVSRNLSYEMNPASFSPGAVKHMTIEARDMREAKQLARSFAPRVFVGSKEIR